MNHMTHFLSSADISVFKKVVLINIVAILMMSAKLANLDFLNP